MFLFSQSSACRKLSDFIFVLSARCCTCFPAYISDAIRFYFLCIVVVCIDGRPVSTRSLYTLFLMPSLIL